MSEAGRLMNALSKAVYVVESLAVLCLCVGDVVGVVVVPCLTCAKERKGVHYAICESDTRKS